MYRKLICLVSFVLAMGTVLTAVANAADPSLVGWWRFDNEGTGTALDYSGYDRHGSLYGSPAFVAGVFNEALESHGNPDYVRIRGYKGVLGPHAFSISAWIKTTDNTGEIMGWGSRNANGQSVELLVLAM